MRPILIALKELGGQGKPQKVRSIIVKNENLIEEELAETRGKIMLTVGWKKKIESVRYILLINEKQEMYT